MINTIHNIKLHFLSTLLKCNGKILGIDYGLKKIGVAIFHSSLDIVLPLKVVIKFHSHFIAIQQLIRENTCIAVVIGISSGGRHRQSVLELQKKIQNELSTPVFLQNEDLTTFAANDLLREAGMRYKKRNSVDDAIAAQLILERFVSDFKQYIKNR